MDQVFVSIATGGWRESAMLKLNSLGFAVSSIPLASSNDYSSRVDIMKHALSKAPSKQIKSCTYIGDGAWDKKACEELGLNFLLVGDKVEHPQSVPNFINQKHVLSFIK